MSKMSLSDEHSQIVQSLYGKIVEKIGSGGYGKIYLTDKNYVVKVEYYEWDLPRRSALNDYEMLSRIDHPNVIKPYDFIFDDKVMKSYLILPKCRKISYYNMPSLIYHIATALKDLHQHNIYHYDITASNIMINEVNIPVIIDFGQSTMYNDIAPTFQYGCPHGYKSWNQWLRHDVGSFDDIYSFGMTIITWLNQSNPLYDLPKDSSKLNLSDVFNLVGYPTEAEKKEYNFVHDVGPSTTEGTLAKYTKGNTVLLDLLQQMLKFAYDKRITAAEILRHPFITKNDLIFYKIPEYTPHIDVSCKYHDLPKYNHYQLLDWYKDDQLEKVKNNHMQIKEEYDRIILRICQSICYNEYELPDAIYVYQKLYLYFSYQEQIYLILVILNIVSYGENDLPVCFKQLAKNKNDKYSMTRLQAVFRRVYNIIQGKVFPISFSKRFKGMDNILSVVAASHLLGVLDFGDDNIFIRSLATKNIHCKTFIKIFMGKYQFLHDYLHDDCPLLQWEDEEVIETINKLKENIQYHLNFN